MLQDEPEEVFAFKRSIATYSGAAFHIPEDDVSMLVGDDIIFTDDASVQIAGQVLQGGQAFSDMGAMDNPFSRHGLRDAESFFAQSLDESCTKHLSQGEFVEQVLGFFLFPLFSGHIHPAPWHDHMDMRVIIQAPGMSVEVRGHADMGAEVFGIEAKIFQGAGDTGKHQLVNKGLMIPCE